MLWWIVDNAGIVYLILGLVGLTLAVRWWLTRRGGLLIALGVTAGLIALVCVLSLVIMTDRKVLVATLREMEEGINRRDLDTVFKHVADDVKVHGRTGLTTIKKEQLRELARQRLGGEEVILWNVAVEQLERPEAVVTFFARIEDTPMMGICKARFEFVREGVWRLKGFEMYRPGDQHQLPIALPF
jgi:hypothetical protein